MKALAGVASPCTNVCRMDERTGLCEGCLRSIDEIIEWSTMDDAAKRDVWALLDARRLEQSSISQSSIAQSSNLQAR